MRRGVAVLLLASVCLVPASAEAADTTPPRTKITAGPGGLTRDATPKFKFTSSERSSTFKCKVDSRRKRACTSPFTTAHLADGPHTFRVFAIDRAGNKDDSPAKRSFVVDTTEPDVTAPDTTLTGGPAQPTSDNVAVFTYTSGETATFQCNLDATGYVPCAPSGYGVTVSRNVTHAFQVRACDAVGNCDPSPAGQAWIVGNASSIPVNGSGEPREADFCRLSFPPALDVTAGGQVTVYGRIFEAGLTPAAGDSGTVTMQVGYGPDGSDPRTTSGWTWVEATFNAGYGPGSPDYVAEEDEYYADFAAPAAAGSPYDYLVRFSLDADNTATYCDLDGAGSNGAIFEPGIQSGQMTVS